MELDPNILQKLDIPVAAETVLYTVPSSRSLTIQGFIFCNRSAGPSSFRLSFSRAGAATTAKDYLYYDLPMLANDTLTVNLDCVLLPTDVVRVYSATGNVSVTLFAELS